MHPLLNNRLLSLLLRLARITLRLESKSVVLVSQRFRAEDVRLPKIITVCVVDCCFDLFDCSAVEVYESAYCVCAGLCFGDGFDVEFFERLIEVVEYFLDVFAGKRVSDFLRFITLLFSSLLCIAPGIATRIASRIATRIFPSGFRGVSGPF